MLRAAFPHFCVECGDEGEMLCGECRGSASVRLGGIFDGERDELDKLVSGGSYADRAFRKLLHHWKYDGVDEARDAILAAFDAFLLRHAALIAAMAGGDAAAVPVPLHPFREARRGFNQSAELAMRIAWTLGMPFLPTLLGRRFAATPQADIDDGKRRRENVAGKFFVRASPPATVILVDDVVTTGATLAECARALRAAGASRVCAVTLLQG